MGCLLWVNMTFWREYIKKTYHDVIEWKHFPRYWTFVQRPVMRSYDVFFYLRLNKRLSKKSEAGDLRRHRVITTSLRCKQRNDILLFLQLYIMSVLRKSLQMIGNGGTPGGPRLHIAHQASNQWSDSGTMRSQSCLTCSNHLLCHRGIISPWLDILRIIPCLMWL